MWVSRRPPVGALPWILTVPIWCPNRETNGVDVTTVDSWSGHRSRLLRQALRLTVREFAEDLGVNPRTISKWESAGSVHCPRPELQAALDTMLGRATYEQRTRFMTSAGIADHPGPSAPPNRSSDAVDERETTATMVPGPPRLPRLTVDQMRQLSQTLDEASHHAEDELVPYFDRQLNACQFQDGSRGPVQALPATLNVIAAIETSARRTSLPMRRQLLCLAARGSKFAGWLYRDAGAFDQATYWYDRAAEWAQEAGSGALQGYVLLRRSQMAYDIRDAIRTLTLAQAAQDGPWQLPIRVRAEVAQQEAIGLAMTGETPVVVARKNDDAHQLLARAVPDDEGSLLLGASFTESTLNLRAAACYAEAGQPARAAELLGAVIAGGTLSRRDEGYFQARRSAALTLGGEPDEAAAVALSSVDTATATNSQRTQRVLDEVAGLLSPWSTRPAVRPLREAVGV